MSLYQAPALTADDITLADVEWAASDRWEIIQVCARWHGKQSGGVDWFPPRTAVTSLQDWLAYTAPAVTSSVLFVISHKIRGGCPLTVVLMACVCRSLFVLVTACSVITACSECYTNALASGNHSCPIHHHYISTIPISRELGFSPPISQWKTHLPEKDNDRCCRKLFTRSFIFLFHEFW